MENETDVMEELSHLVHAEPVRAASSDRDSGNSQNREETDPDKTRILQLLDAYPQHIDQLIETSRMPSDKVSAILLELELMGAIKHHPGNYFSIS